MTTAAPVITSNLNNLNIRTDAPATVINLSDNFDDPFTTGVVARFELVDASLEGGVTDVLLFDQEGEGAPNSVDNFLRYVEDGDYVNSIIHRSIPGFVVQGGGFTIDGLGDTTDDPAEAVGVIPTDDPIENEFSPERSNTRGTIAFAKSPGDPDSATSQFFFNLDDNVGLDTQNGGFTVFGEVLDEDDLAVLDAIAALPTSDEVELFNQNAFSDLPLIVDDEANPVIDSDANLVQYQNISILDLDELAFEVSQNSNPDLVEVFIRNGNELVLDYRPGQEGTAEITVQATNLVGEVVEESFTVSVSEDAPVDTLPTTTGIANVTVDEDSSDTIISLFDSFDDLEDGSENLDYEVLSNTNPALFSSVDIDPVTGELTLAYTPDLSGTAEITVEAEDSAGQTVEATFSVTVNAVNDAPIGVDDNVPNTGQFITTASAPLVISVDDGVLNNDFDPEGDSLTATLVSDAGNGSVQLNQDGSFSYTPATGFTGIDSFTYTASDSISDSAETSVNIEVNALPPLPDDAIQGSADNEKLKGSSSFDYLAGLDGEDRLRGRNGNDTIDGGAGIDNIKGQGGNDLIDGGLDSDRIDGGKNNDTIFGGAGNDAIRGQKGSDLLVGGVGNDWIRGGSGNDTLIGGAGNDTLRGNRGDDIYVLEANGGGFDVFEKFKLGRDLIGLGDDLTFDDLSFQSTSSRNTSVFFNDQLIAVIQQRGSGNLDDLANFTTDF